MTQKIGTTERPVRVAIVGSGPSGFYAAAALLADTGLAIEVDVLDRLPTPFGLVRGGVAPDHQKIKTVIKAYEKTAADARFRFFGNVDVGRGVPTADLYAHYDQVVWAVGAETANKLGIPGEDLVGSHSATEFVGWYNGHPDHVHRKFDLQTRSAVVVGVGNVAMDVARVLACDAKAHLGPTDAAGYAIDALAQGGLSDVHILGRRGPAQASFTFAELKEIADMSGIDLSCDPGEVRLDALSQDWLDQSGDTNAKRNCEYLRERAMATRIDGGRCRVHVRMLVSPVEILGDSAGRVAGVKVEKNTLASDGKGGLRAVGTGKTEVIPCGLVFRAVGYRGIAVPGVPFDEKRGTIPNVDGRVVDAAGQVVPGAYVVGWAKRGPSGLIGTNRADSKATVEQMLADVRDRDVARDPRRTREAIDALLAAHAPRRVDWADWKRIDAAELAEGAKAGRVRTKFTRVEDMLAAAGK